MLGLCVTKSRNNISGFAPRESFQTSDRPRFISLFLFMGYGGVNGRLLPFCHINKGVLCLAESFTIFRPVALVFDDKTIPLLSIFEKI